MKAVPVTIRTIGNSRGVLLSKTVLAQVGLDQDDAAELSVKDGAIILRKAGSAVRAGWARAAQAIADREEDALVMGEFANADDAEWRW